MLHNSRYVAQEEKSSAGPLLLGLNKLYSIRGEYTNP